MIAAEGEHKASRTLRHAAEILSENPIAIQLRYLQTLEGIAEVNNSTIVFPVPVDLMGSMTRMMTSTLGQTSLAGVHP